MVGWTSRCRYERQSPVEPFRFGESSSATVAAGWRRLKLPYRPSKLLRLRRGQGVGEVHRAGNERVAAGGYNSGVSLFIIR